MRRYRTVAIIALLGIVPMIAAVFVLRFVLPSAQPEKPRAAPAQQAAPAPVKAPELRMVLAAARALPVGTLLGEEDISELGIELDLVRKWHIAADDPKRSGALYGYVVRQEIAEGAPVTWQSLVGPGQRGFLAAVLRPGMRAITVTLGQGTSHSGLVDPGDRVDVVLAAVGSRGGGLRDLLARTILEDVRVLAVDRRVVRTDGSGAIERTEEKIVTATLEVLPSQTSLLALGELGGELALAVRPLAAAGAPAEPVEVVRMQSLLPLPQAAPTMPEPELHKAVRVIRGTAIADESFGIDGEPAAFDNARVDDGIE